MPEVCLEEVTPQLIPEGERKRKKELTPFAKARELKVKVGRSRVLRPAR